MRVVADRGLEVRGGFRRERDVALEAPRVLHEMRSPITSVMDAILLDSNNAVADQLFLATGAATGGADRCPNPEGGSDGGDGEGGHVRLFRGVATS